MSSYRLVKLPRLLAPGIDRRLPRGNRFKDLTGRKYEQCAVLGLAGYRGNHAAWLCRCRCGNLFVREGAYLSRPYRQKCGCTWAASKSTPKEIRLVFKSVKARCYNPNHEMYHLYGARGIQVCQRWLASVADFARDMGPRPSRTHIVVRRDPTGDFTPENCSWGTREQALRRTRDITYAGRTHCMADWARKLGISSEAMRLRVNRCLERGLSPSAAVAAPVDRKKATNAKRRRR
jgi:hypothetical protein